MDYRIGIDVGTNSLGWAAIALKQNGDGWRSGPLLDMGVRIFSDGRHPKDKSSNAAQRRAPRSARRNRDRKLMRRKAMLRELTLAGLFPTEESGRAALQSLDPWILRARALDEALTAHEVGRALFHLQQRRGFKSNRKTDGDAEGAMLTAIQEIKDRLKAEGFRTLGELFGQPRIKQQRRIDDSTQESGPMPQARVKARFVGSKMAYDYYPDRSLILDEFDQLWRAQSEFHPSVMTSEAYEKIRRVIEYQRPLKPQQAGKCTFLPDLPRAPKALPSSQLARILQEVNNLRVGEAGQEKRALTQSEREALVQFLRSNQPRKLPKSGKRTFGRIRELLKLGSSQVFSHESAKRDHLLGDITAVQMMNKSAYGPQWFELSLAQQDCLISELLDTEQFEDYKVEGAPVSGFASFALQNFDLDEDRAHAIFGTRLADSHGKLSKAALDRIIPRMERGEAYDQAAREEFGDHRALGDGAIYERGLPYYGEVLNRHTAFEKPDPQNDEDRYGKIANPTVHVALNQLGKVINDLIRRYGTPTQIVLELARDLPLSDRGLRDLEKTQRTNQKANEIRRETLSQISGANPNSYEDRLKLRLFDEAMASFGGVVVCPFSGDTINKTDLFNGKAETEHILPLSRTLDDGYANKVLSTRAANHMKGNKSPHEAFSASPSGFNWAEISQRASQLPSSKAWRFDPDAMERFEESGGFLARQLNDTRYIARLGKSYVEAIFGGQGAKGHDQRVWVVPGRLTSDLRYYAGLNQLTGLNDSNKKDRTDHRHHAVDALIVALTDSSVVQRAANLAKHADNKTARLSRAIIMREMAEPLKRYRREAEDRLSKLVVSHKPDHGHQDAMHNDTAYGITRHEDANGKQIVVTRKPVSELKPKDLEQIADPVLAQYFQSQTSDLEGKAFESAVIQAGLTKSPKVQSVRLHSPMSKSSLVTIKHGPKDVYSKAYKGDGNYSYDIFQDAKGRWTGRVVSTFEAYQQARIDPQWWRKPLGLNGEALVMRLRKGDMLELEVNGRRTAVCIYKMSIGKIVMAEHMEANASGRVRSKELAAIQKSPGSLQQSNAVKLSVSPSGRVRRLH